MPSTTTNMGLVRWTGINDLFNHTQLSENFRRLDEHDHSGAPDKGVPIPTGGIGNLAVTTAKVADLNITSGKLADGSVTTAKVANQAVTAAKVGVLPQARVFHNVGQTIANGTLTALAFNSERFDSDTIHDTATNNGRLTCKTAGLYVITACVEWAANATGSRYAAIRLNGTNPIVVDRRASAGSGNATRQSLATLYRLNVNDYLEVLVQQDSTAGLDVLSVSNYSPEFSMAFLSNF